MRERKVCIIIFVFNLYTFSAIVILDMLLYLLVIASMISTSLADVINISWGQLEGPNHVPVLPHFWTSTGFSPMNIHDGLTKDEQVNLALIGSLPGGSITHVRIHWLLNLVTARRRGEEDVEFDFSRLDSTLALLRRYNLYPAFEVMGNPSSIFSDLHSEQQQLWWKLLVTLLARRYITKYGLDQVKHWRFESWNEPDLRMYNTLNFTLESFKAYFLATAQGLHEASNGQLLLGGPAGLFRTPRYKHPLCWGLLDLATQRSHLQLAFISLHRKGNASSRTIVKDTLELVRDFKQRYPSLRNLTLANDEADPLKSWWRDKAWRADVRYAAMLARITIDHLNLTRARDFAVKFISNDNAFLSSGPHFFTQRTLLARFVMNETHTQFVAKPVYVVLALMSLLGDRELPTQIDTMDPRVATLSSGTWHKDGSFSAAILIVFNNETASEPSEVVHFNITLPVSEMMSVARTAETRYSVFMLDNLHTNPSAEWRREGKPQYPSATLRRSMRRSQEYRPVTSQVLPETGRVSFYLQLPSVALLQLCTRSDLAPGHVSGLHGLKVTRDEVLLLWRDTHVGTRCLLRYEVEFRARGETNFHRVNVEENSILLNYHFQIDSAEEIVGDYRVRAVDLWRRPGHYSNIFHYDAK